MAKSDTPKLVNGKIPYLFDGGLDAGLIMLSALTDEGETRTLEEIAFVCGVKWQAIHAIEQRAIKKIRAEMERRKITRI